jgi:MFS transporter, PPP family, 3-phenylpropionic acid transporter
VRSLGVYYFLYYLSQASLLPYISIYLQGKGISATAIGMILSLWALVSVISQPVMGMINDRISDQRRILMISSVFAPIVGLGFYFLEGYPALIILSILFSWFQASAVPLSDSLAVEIGNQQGFSFGSVRLWGALSFSLGAVCTGFLYEKIGYDKGFLIYLGISIFVVFTLFFIPNVKSSRHHLSMFEQAKEVFLNKAFLIFVCICLLISMSMAINFSFLPIYLNARGFDKKWIGIAYSIAALIEVPMFWLSAWLNNRMNRLYVLCLAAGFYAIKCLLLYVSHNLFLVLSLQLFDGISYAFFISAAVETVESLSAAHTKSTYQTLFAAITSGLGGIIGSALGGIIVGHWGAPTLYFILFLLCMAASVLFAVTKISSSKKRTSFRENA